jgi:hypothetical protein
MKRPRQRGEDPHAGIGTAGTRRQVKRPKRVASVQYLGKFSDDGADGERFKVQVSGARGELRLRQVDGSKWIPGPGGGIWSFPVECIADLLLVLLEWGLEPPQELKGIAAEASRAKPSGTISLSNLEL